MDSDSDSPVINLVDGEMDSQNGFGFAVYVLKSGLVDKNLQHRCMESNGIATFLSKMHAEISRELEHLQCFPDLHI